MSILKPEGKLYSRLFWLMLPLALQNLVSFGVGLADNLMVGILGDDALSGVFAANQFTNILGMLMSGVGAALVILSAQYWGRKDRESVKTITAMVAKMSLVMGAVFCLTIQLFGRPILGLITPVSKTVDMGMRYARIVSLGYVFFCITQVLMASMRCVGNTRIGFYVSLVTFVGDVGLNYLMIFGFSVGGVQVIPAMGVAGAALSTVIARVMECFAISLYVLRWDQNLVMRIKDFARFHKALAADFFRYGAPVMLGDVLWGIGNFVQALVLGNLGAALGLSDAMSQAIMSANAISINIHQMFGVVVYATAGAAGVIIGQTVGSGNYERVKQYAKTLQLVFLGVGMVSGALLFLGKDGMLWLMQAFKDSKLTPEAVAYARQFLIVMSVTLVGTGYQMSSLGGLVKAGGATSFVLINDLIFVWLVVVPSAAIAGYVLHAPPWVVFALLKGDQVYKCAVAVVKVNRFRWIKKLTRDDVVAESA